MANDEMEDVDSVASTSETFEEEDKSQFDDFLQKIDVEFFLNEQDGGSCDPSADRREGDSVYDGSGSSHNSIPTGSSSPGVPDDGTIRKNSNLNTWSKLARRNQTRDSDDSVSDISDYETFSDIDDFFVRHVFDPVLDNYHYDGFEDLGQIVIGAPLDSDLPKLPLFEQGKLVEAECQICLIVGDLHLRTCCSVPVCDSCLQEYFNVQVNQKIVKLPCLNPFCNAYVSRDEIVFRLDNSGREKFHRFLMEANKEPHMKTCPRCSHLFAHDKDVFAKAKLNPNEAKVTCTECYLVWCFPCHAPWHEGISCRDYRKGDKLLKMWSKERSYGQNNAQRCPKCRVYIQRSSGCDHMTCSRCKTEFCYRCGQQFRSLKFIGDHYSRLSVFGCKYRFKPDNPVQRRMIRGAVLGGKILAAPVVASLAVGAGGLLLAVGTVALPVYGSYKLHKKIQRHKKEQKVRKWRKKLAIDFELQYRVVVRPPMRLVPREPTTMPSQELDILY